MFIGGPWTLDRSSLQIWPSSQPRTYLPATHRSATGTFRLDAAGFEPHSRGSMRVETEQLRHVTGCRGRLVCASWLAGAQPIAAEKALSVGGKLGG